MDLPPAERNVSIYTYIAEFGGDRVIDELLEGDPDNHKTTDEQIYNISKRKEVLLDYFLKIMKESAVDCIMNDPDNREYSIYHKKGEEFSCFYTDIQDPDIPMFYPDLPTDRLIASEDATAYKKALVEDADDDKREVGEAPPRRPYRTLQALTIKRKGEDEAKSYSISAKPEDSTKYYLFDIKDYQQVYAVGEMEKDPVQEGKFRAVKFFPEKIKVK
jgi:hypothetical protein